MLGCKTHHLSICTFDLDNKFHIYTDGLLVLVVFNSNIHGVHDVYGIGGDGEYEYDIDDLGNTHFMTFLCTSSSF